MYLFFIPVAGTELLKFWNFLMRVIRVSLLC